MFLLRINSYINKRCMLKSELAYKNRLILSKSQMLRGQKVGKGLQEKDLTHERSAQSCKQLWKQKPEKRLEQDLHQIQASSNGIWTTFKSGFFLGFFYAQFPATDGKMSPHFAPEKRAGCMGLLLLILRNQTTYFSWSRF